MINILIALLLIAVGVIAVQLKIIHRYEYAEATLIGNWCTDRPDLIPQKAKDKYYWEITAETFK